MAHDISSDLWLAETPPGYAPAEPDGFPRTLVLYHPLGHGPLSVPPPSVRRAPYEHCVPVLEGGHPFSSTQAYYVNTPLRRRWHRDVFLRFRQGGAGWEDCPSEPMPLTTWLVRKYTPVLAEHIGYRFEAQQVVPFNSVEYSRLTAVPTSASDVVIVRKSNGARYKIVVNADTGVPELMGIDARFRPHMYLYRTDD